MSKITLDEYLNKLAARNPVPGGGSAAALTGAIGMSLVSMVAKYLKRRDSSEKLSKILKFTERSRRLLRRLMIEDEGAYLRLSKAIKRKSPMDITNLYKKALEIPLEVCTVLSEGQKRCGELRMLCKTSLAQDLKEAAVLLKAGFLSAKLNVEINLDGVKDRPYVKKIKRILKKIGRG